MTNTVEYDNISKDFSVVKQSTAKLVKERSGCLAHVKGIQEDICYEKEISTAPCYGNGSYNGIDRLWK